MPLKLKQKSLDEMKKEAIESSVAERGYKNGGKVKKPAKKPMGYASGGKVLVKGKNC